MSGSDRVLLHEGWAIMPLGNLTATWEPGKKYVYTFVFGSGDGGYDGGDGTDPDPDTTPDPVLTKISYTCTIDDFDAFAGGNADVDMETI